MFPSNLYVSMGWELRLGPQRGLPICLDVNTDTLSVVTLHPIPSPSHPHSYLKREEERETRQLICVWMQAK